MFGKSTKKKGNKPTISPPTNFEHRVHTGYDHVNGTFVGLPKQWAGVVEPQSNINRPKPFMDPSIITDVQPLKVSLVNVLHFYSI